MSRSSGRRCTAVIGRPQMRSSARARRSTCFDAAASGTSTGSAFTARRRSRRRTRVVGRRIHRVALRAYLGGADAVLRVIDAGSDVSAARNDMRVQPLHSAAALGDVAACELLLDAGADPNATQQGGFVPLDEALLTKNDALATLLRSRGAKVSGAEHSDKPRPQIAKVRVAERLHLIERVGDASESPDQGMYAQACPPAHGPEPCRKPPKTRRRPHHQMGSFGHRRRAQTHHQMGLLATVVFGVTCRRRPRLRSLPARRPGARRPRPSSGRACGRRTLRRTRR